MEKMKRLVLPIVAVAGALMSVFLFGSAAVTVHAETRTPLTEAHKQRIVSQCTSAKSSLRQLHRSDASLRVNRGQLYEFIGTKLMARLNGRLVVNRLDASVLVGVTAKYDRALVDFRNTYRFYEERLSSLLRMDCSKQPEAFYYDVLETREKRAEVRKKVNELNRIMNEYLKEFVKFSEDYRTASKGLNDGRP